MHVFHMLVAALLFSFVYSVVFFFFTYKYIGCHSQCKLPGCLGLQHFLILRNRWEETPCTKALNSEEVEGLFFHKIEMADT